MQVYADYIKTVLDKYKFYRNIDIIDRAVSLLDVTDKRYIYKNNSGKVYCIENSLRIFVNDNGVCSTLTEGLETDRKYNFVVVFVEGRADLSNAFTNLKCNTFILLSADDSNPVIVDKMFKCCEIGTVILNAITASSFGELFTSSVISYCEISDVNATLNTKSEFVIAKDSVFTVLNIRALDVSPVNYIPYFLGSRMNKLYFVGAPEYSIASPTTAIGRLVVDCATDLIAYQDAITLYVEVLEDFDEGLKSYHYFVDTLLRAETVMFNDLMFVNKTSATRELLFLPNSFNAVDEITTKDNCQLQCAVHGVTGQTCNTYINPDLKYITLCLPPVETINIYGGFNVGVLNINCTGVRPNINFKGELRKAVDCKRCVINNFNKDSILCRGRSKNTEESVGVFSEAFKQAIGTMTGDFSNPDEAKSKIVRYTTTDNQVTYLA